MRARMGDVQHPSRAEACIRHPQQQRSGEVEDPLMIDPQEKVESNQVGRAVIGGLVIFILASLLAANIPQTSYLQKKLNSIVEPVRHSVGLAQTSSVFGP